jgi:hypothetical protein
MSKIHGIEYTVQIWKEANQFVAHAIGCYEFGENTR